MSTCKCVCELLPSLISFVYGSGINYGKALMSIILPLQRMMRQLRSSVSQHLFCIVRTNLIFRSPLYFDQRTMSEWIFLTVWAFCHFSIYYYLFWSRCVKDVSLSKYLYSTRKLCISICPIKQSGDSQQQAKIVLATLKCPRKNVLTAVNSFPLTWIHLLGQNYPRYYWL